MKKKISRRQVLQGAVSLAALTAAGCVSAPKKKDERNPNSVPGWEGDNVYEFIVVGSGAGGGPLACRLAQAGFSVLLVEAGSKNSPQTATVPALHAQATDDPAINWSFFVQRYSDNNQNAKNSKYTPNKGLYYPRGSTLGGSTTMNAMISLYPDHQDWEHIRKLTGDSSWGYREMYEHFERLQVALPDRNKPFFDYLKAQVQRGWLELSQNSVGLLLQDKQLLDIVLGAFKMQGIPSELLKKIYAEDWNIKLNPNTQAAVLARLDGLYNIPVSIKNGARRGVRDFIVETAERYPDKLKIQSNSLVKNLIFPDSDRTRVVGVEYAEGENLYSAHQNSSQSTPYTIKKAFATKEVILCGGAFNTPQLLQLSGIGDEKLLRQKGIEVRAHLPGVGTNLQDRYEVSVASSFAHEFATLAKCGFNSVDDACMREYLQNPTGGAYGTNGIAIALLKRSSQTQPTPDLCIFGVPSYFKGYYPNWSKDAYHKNVFTWVILKGHTKNHAGTVSIKSADFRDTPDINFKAFADGSDFFGEDMKAIMNGLEIARTLNQRLPARMGAKEIYPGPEVKTSADMNQFIRNESWGHHASCTSPMGRADDENAVVDSEFRVRKMTGLRIVDASVFPDIPGLFLMVPILTISEKAAQLLIRKHKP